MIDHDGDDGAAHGSDPDKWPTWSTAAHRDRDPGRHGVQVGQGALPEDVPTEGDENLVLVADCHGRHRLLGTGMFMWPT